MIEAQARFVARCLRRLDRLGARHVEPTEETTDRFNRRLQNAMGRMVFSGGCGAWYTDATDFNYTLWPWSATRFVLDFLRRPERELTTN
jgi:hypothetical protein